jgi:hypothetical protein
MLYSLIFLQHLLVVSSYLPSTFLLKDALRLQFVSTLLWSVRAIFPVHVWSYFSDEPVVWKIIESSSETAFSRPVHSHFEAQDSGRGLGSRPVSSVLASSPVCSAGFTYKLEEVQLRASAIWVASWFYGGKITRGTNNLRCCLIILLTNMLNMLYHSLGPC